MLYISTRNNSEKLSGAEAIVKGLSDNGGLYVPESFPKVAMKDIENMAAMDYYERAAFIIGKYLPQFDEKTLKGYTQKAYSRFSDDPGSLVKVDENVAFLELWHGPTHAFKDIALTLLPYLMTGSKKVLGKNEKTLILVATSGDTGKAALEGFKDVEGTDVIVFYPVDGVSKLQKLQMMTQEGSNVTAYAINGNFDDAQNTVKKIFGDGIIANELAAAGYNLSSANSINWGRLVPQIVYYFSSYADLLESKQIKKGEKINFCVPSGNFGNILAGYYAMQMGLPVNKLICASNKNNVLTDFINGGSYDLNGREFFKTSSPSMDILISSNLERLVFELSGRDSSLTQKRMAELKTGGVYSITAGELVTLKSQFYAGFASEEEVKETIDSFFEEYGYIMDTHTGVAVNVYEKYAEATGDESKTVIVSTASPYKFADDVLKALGSKPGKDELSSLKKLEELTALPVPESLSCLMKMPQLHKEVIDKADAAGKVISYCKNKRMK